MRGALLLLAFLLLSLPAAAKKTVRGDSIFVEIHSMADWDQYAKEYGGTHYFQKYGTQGDEVCPYYLDVKLFCDINFDNNSTHWEYFSGHFDGQGHAFNLNFEDNKKDHYVFGFIGGTFENLIIKGKIEYRQGCFSFTQNCFAYQSDMYLTMINCHNRVEYYEMCDNNVFDWWFYDNVPVFGGFLAYAYGKSVFISDSETIYYFSEVEFQDCSFVGSFTKKNGKDKWFDTGGFVGEQKLSYVKFKNCLSCMTLSDGPEAEDLGFFVGQWGDSKKITAENSYCYSPSKIASKVITNGATFVTADQLKSGEIAYKLAAGRTGDDNPWRQLLGTEEWPEASISSPTSKEVKKAEPQEFNVLAEWYDVYSPLGVTVPSGNSKYIVTARDDENHTLTLSKLQSDATANIPLIIHNDNGKGIGTVKTAGGYYNEQDQNGILRGTTVERKAESGEYTRDGNTFTAPGDATIPAMRNYIAGADGDKYTFEISDKDYYVISSKEAWNTFKTAYGSGEGTEVTAYLDCDLTLTADDVAMNSFKGTLDGQGHSIIYDFDERNTDHDVECKDGTVYGFIKYAAGTIKNLNLTGKIKTKCRFVGGPLAWACYYGPLNVENCHSDVDFSTTYSELRYTYTYGFLSTTSDAVSFTDCSFNGAFTSDKIPHSGGFVGQIFYNKVTFTNCYSNVHTGEGSALYDYAGYFVGLENYEDTHTYTNCYAHNSSELEFKAYSDGLTIPTDEQLTDGTTTAQLNNGRTGDVAPWAQLLGTHKEPQLKTFIGNGDGVKYAAGTIAKDENAHWTTLYYPADVTFTAEQGITVYDKFDTDEDGNLLIYENLSGTVKAGNPAILYAENGFTEDIALPAVYYNADDFTGNGAYLTGVTAETETDAAARYTLTENADGTQSFAAAAEDAFLPAWQCYTTGAYAKLIADGAIIYSKDNWNTFKTKYNGKKQGFARLACDLTLGSNDEPMENFVGTFDGQGHTVTVNFTNHDGYRAMFKYAKGSTIRNLNLDGTITTTTSGSLDQAPLIYTVEGTQGAPDTLTVENCHSSVRFIAEGNNNIIWAGGFVRYVQTYATVNFTDCSFTGGFETKGQVTNSGGFIGLNYSNGTANTVNFTNCFSAPTNCAIGSTSSSYPIGYFCGGTMSKLTYNVKNCYAQKADNFTNKDSKITLLDSATIAKGSAAYALNAGRSGSNAPWRQTVGTDALPQLKLFSPDSKEVYVAADTVKIGKAGWSTHYYPLTETLPEGVKAYKVSGVGNENDEYIVNLEEVTGTIPAYTPVLLCTLADIDDKEAEKAITIQMPDLYYNELKETDLEDNGQDFQLIGVTRDTETFDGCYILQQHTNATTGEKKTAFYRVDTSVATPYVRAWKCVLVYKGQDAESGEGTESNVRAVNLRLDGTTTAIGAVEAVNAILSDGPAYDLSGRRVRNLQKGNVYIKNGKKFIIK